MVKPCISKCDISFINCIKSCVVIWVPVPFHLGLNVAPQPYQKGYMIKDSERKFYKLPKARLT